MAVFFLFRLAFGYRACLKSCLDNSVNHLFDGHLAGIVSDNGLLFSKTHFCLLDSLSPSRAARTVTGQAPQVIPSTLRIAVVGVSVSPA